MINRLSNIKGGTITKVIAGGSNGAIIVLDIESQKSSYVLFIYCSWRLSEGREAITSSAEEESSFAKELVKLKGKEVSNVLFSDLGDFSLEFENKKLDIFCDSVFDHEKKEDWENWSVCDLTTNECTIFTNRFDFKIEPYVESN